jgi:hypothetical protein
VAGYIQLRSDDAARPILRQKLLIDTSEVVPLEFWRSSTETVEDAEKSAKAPTPRLFFCLPELERPATTGIAAVMTGRKIFERHSNKPVVRIGREGFS